VYHELWYNPIRQPKCYCGPSPLTFHAAWFFSTRWKSSPYIEASAINSSSWISSYCDLGISFLDLAALMPGKPVEEVFGCGFFPHGEVGGILKSDILSRAGRYSDSVERSRTQPKPRIFTRCLG